MQPIFRILRKDLYHYRWAWVFFIVVSVIKILLNGTSLGWISPNFYDAWKPLIESLPWLMGFILVVLAVQDETLGTPDAYWTSRPVRRLHTLLAKLLFCGIVLCGIFVLSDAIILILNKGAHRLPWLLLSLLTATAWLWAVILLAAQTRSLARFALMLLGIGIGLQILMAALMSFAAFGGWMDDCAFDPGILPEDVSIWSIALIQYSLWTVAGGLLLILYYQTRRLICWLGLIPIALCSAILTPESPICEQACMASVPTEDKEPACIFTGENLSYVISQNEHDVRSYQFSARIEDSSLPAGKDLWIKNTRIQFNGRDLRYTIPNRSGIEACTVSTDPTGVSSFTCSLFHIDAEELLELTDQPVDIMVDSEMLIWNGLSPIGVMPLRAKQTFAHNGHRLGIELVEFASSMLGWEIETTVSSYTQNLELEKTDGDRHESRFLTGDYLFQIRDPSTSVVYPCNIDREWSHSREAVKITTLIPTVSQPENLELVISEMNDLKEKPFKAMFKDVNLRQIAGLPPAGSSTQ